MPRFHGRRQDCRPRRARHVVCELGPARASVEEPDPRVDDQARRDKQHVRRPRHGCCVARQPHRHGVWERGRADAALGVAAPRRLSGVWAITLPWASVGEAQMLRPAPSGQENLLPQHSPTPRVYLYYAERRAIGRPRPSRHPPCSRSERSCRQSCKQPSGLQPHSHSHSHSHSQIAIASREQPGEREPAATGRRHGRPRGARSSSHCSQNLAFAACALF